MMPTATTESASSTATPPPGNDELRTSLITEAVAELRPALKAHGGDCELVCIEGNRVHLRLKGSCVGCVLASVTISGVQERLIRKLGFPIRVVPAT